VTVTPSYSDAAQPPGEDRRVVARVFALTDVGRSREHNEDTFLVADLESGATVEFDQGHQEIGADAHGLLFLVADGMGGAASGELASSMAGELVLEGLRNRWTPNAKLSADSPNRCATSPWPPTRVSISTRATTRSIGGWAPRPRLPDCWVTGCIWCR
jgi:hypothetical protein